MTTIRPGAFYEIRSKDTPTLVLAVSQASMKPDAEIVLFTSNEERNQQFSFEQVAGVDNRWVIVARHSGMCLDVRGRSKDNNARVIQYPKNEQANQQWDLKDSADGTFTLRAVHSGKVMDAETEVRINTHVIQYQAHDSVNQSWTVRER